MNNYEWPKGFKCTPSESWATEALEELAMKYDTVEEHGWYDNLDATVEQISNAYSSDALLLDYSGGTGILTDRIMREMKHPPSMMIVDSSPKFLRLALEKLRKNKNVAYRLIRYLREEKRLQTLREVVDPLVYEQGVDAVVSTNAIHLYYGLPKTMGSWYDILKDEGRIFVQSGNIRNPNAPKSSWIIDETVEYIHQAALRIVQSQSEYQHLRPYLDDKTYMEAHDRLRRKYFLPVRDLSYYADCIESSGFTIEGVEHRSIKARVDQWYSFLEVYHEGVLGWVGGAEKITKKAPSTEMVSLRKELMWKGMREIFKGQDSFDAVWTYITAKK